MYLKMLASFEDSFGKKAECCRGFTGVSSNSCLQDVVAIIFESHSLMWVFFSPWLSKKIQKGCSLLYFAGVHKLPLFHIICVA